MSKRSEGKTGTGWWCPFFLIPVRMACPLILTMPVSLLSMPRIAGAQRKVRRRVLWLMVAFRREMQCPLKDNTM
jgi:hypothetical protein